MKSQIDRKYYYFVGKKWGSKFLEKARDQKLPAPREASVVSCLCKVLFNISSNSSSESDKDRLLSLTNSEWELALKLLRVLNSPYLLP